MKTLKAVLSQDMTTKNEAELRDLLKNLSKVISKEEFQKVSSLNPLSELSNLSSTELLAVVEDFKKSYKAVWDSQLGKASAAAVKAIFKSMDEAEDRMDAMAASDADFASELNNINFAKIIGGPLSAAVDAQANASFSTIEFIKEIGFDYDDDGEVIGVKKVEFVYEEDGGIVRDANGDPVLDGNGDVQALPPVKKTIQVPLISIVNVPSLRIETIDIDFNVKLNSVFSKKVSSEIGVKTEGSFGWGPVKFKVSASYKRTSSTGVKVEKEYSMNVKVKATNDEMPAGLEKVLNLLSA